MGYFCFLWKHSGYIFAIVLFYVDLSRNLCKTPFYLHILIALLKNCMVTMNAREEIIFKREINIFSTKKLQKLLLEFSVNILKLKSNHLKKNLYERE